MERGFHEEGMMIRITGDTIALSPAADRDEAQIGEIFDKVGTRDQGRSVTELCVAATSGRERRLRPQDRPADRANFRRAELQA